MNGDALSATRNTERKACAGTSPLPLLVKLAVAARMASDPPVTRYDTLTETCQFGSPRDGLPAIWATGSYGTRAELDPTRDESTDR